MPSKKRGGRAAIARETVFTAAAIAVVAIVAFSLYYVSTGPHYTEAEKAEYRRACVEAYHDSSFSYTSVEQCATLWPAAKAACSAWVSGDQTYCAGRLNNDKVWCIAKATKNPNDCNTREGDAATYCKAYVTKNGAACDQLINDGTRLSCVATVRGDLAALYAQTAELCGEEFEPSQ